MEEDFTKGLDYQFMQQPRCVSPDNTAEGKELISEIHRLNDASWVTFWKYEITKMVNRSVIAGVTWDSGEMDATQGPTVGLPVAVEAFLSWLYRCQHPGGDA